MRSYAQERSAYSRLRIAPADKRAEGLSLPELRKNKKHPIRLSYANFC